MIKIKLTFLFLLFLTASYYGQNYIVYGAGDTMANGLYIEMGMNEGCPYYKKGNYFLAYTEMIGCQHKWVILKDSTEMIYKNYWFSYYPPGYDWLTTCNMNSISPPPIVFPEGNAVIYNKQDVHYFENNTNDGSVDNSDSLVIQLLNISGESFTGNAGDDFYADHKVEFNGIPAGLTPYVEKLNDSTLFLKFYGNALAHNQYDDVYNAMMSLNDSAFAGGDTASVFQTQYYRIHFNFSQPSIYYYGQSFHESDNNDGSFDSTNYCHIKIHPFGNEGFNGVQGENFLNTGKATIANVPPGLNAQMELINDTLICLTFLGNALSHGEYDDVSCVIVFNDQAFNIYPATGILNSTYSNINLFFDQPYIYFSGQSFYESADNNGTMDSSNYCTIKIMEYGNETFEGTIGENFYTSGKVGMFSVPQGLIPEIIMESETTLVLVFKDTALYHNDSNDTYVGIEFYDQAFTNGNAAELQNSMYTNIRIDFTQNIRVKEVKKVSYNIYPVPAKDYICIDYNDPDFLDQNIYIFDNSGNLVLQSLVKRIIDVRLLKSGVYYICVGSNRLSGNLKKIVIN